MTDWQGITYPRFLQVRWVYPLWRYVCCARGWHLWDEVGSSLGHYLSCDACDKAVLIDPIPLHLECHICGDVGAKLLYHERGDWVCDTHTPAPLPRRSHRGR